MQLRPQEIKNIYKSGVFVTGLLVVFTVFVFTLSKVDSVFESKTHLSTITKNVQNLKPGAAVHLKGTRIGSVRKVEFLNIDEIRISFFVREKFQYLIKKDSYVAFKTQGVLGDTYIEILGGSSDAPMVTEGHTLKTGEGKGMQALLNKSGSILENANRVISRIDGILLGIQEKSKITETLANLNIITKSMAEMMEDNNFKGTMSNIRATSNNLNKMTKNLASISNQVKAGPGTVHSLIYDDTVYEDLTTLLGGAHRSKIIKYFIRESIKKNEKLQR